MSSKIRDIGVFNVKNMGYRGKKNLIYMQLRVMRVKRDVSQKELSARMQVMGFSMDQQTISNIENNKRIVTDYELAGFCRALHCTERELLADYYEKYKEE
jgi:transcriptional regulator with XRE-family HTH domain